MWPLGHGSVEIQERRPRQSPGMFDVWNALWALSAVLIFAALPVLLVIGSLR